MTGKITTQVDGAIGWIIIDNESKRNAVNLAMWRALPVAVAELDDNRAIRTIVLRGAGTTAFVAGADIAEFEQTRFGAAATDYTNINQAAFSAIKTARTPTIAMIHGFCVGGGLAIALSADIRYSDLDGRFTIPAAKLGIGYPASGVTDLETLVGPSVAKEILFSARLFGVEHALRWGLVNDAVPAQQLEAHVRAMAGRIAANAPLTQQAVKLAIDGAPSVDVEAAVQRCLDSADYREGVAAFLEKRPAEFTGH